MSFKQRSMVSILCDGCGTDLDDDDYGYLVFEDERAASDCAHDSDWWVRWAQHFCPDCPPTWCLECGRSITEGNPRCRPEDLYSCAGCHTDCGDDDPCRSKP